MLKNFKLVFDIGAYDGGYAGILLQEGVSKIICIEPNPSSYSKIIAKFANDDRVVALNNAAATNHNDTLTYHISSKHPPIGTVTDKWTTSSRFAGNRDENGIPYEWDNKVEVQTVNVDHLVQIYGVPDLIKIDTEGFEDHVIKGLTTYHKDMIITFEISEELLDITQNALKYLNELGYSDIGIVEGDDPARFPAKYHSYNKFINKMNIAFPSPAGDFFGMVFVKG